MTPPDFRALFPEFFDVNAYPDARIAMYLTIAALQVNVCRFADLSDYVTGLVVAHHVTLASRNLAIAEAGGQPGTASGPVSAKSIDKVSITYDAQAVQLDGMGAWGLTSYGLEFLTMCRTFGAGPLQL